MLCFFVVDAYENARFLCDQYYMTSPEAEFQVVNRKLIVTLCYNALPWRKAAPTVY